MCSIGGFISNPPLDPATARLLCRALIHYGQTRGQQSAGIYANGTVYKRAQSPATFIAARRKLNELFTAPVAVALTHTRAPTSGGLGHAQAQPFRKNNTVTVHNGWISNCDDLLTRWQLRKDAGVDSELITAFVAQFGPEMLPDFLDSTKGTVATAVLHNGKLYVARDGNPLEYLRLTLHDDTKITVFGSTEEQVRLASAMCWLLPATYNRTITLQSSEVFELTPDALVSNANSRFSCGFAYRNERKGKKDKGSHPYGRGYWHNGKFVPVNDNNIHTAPPQNGSADQWLAWAEARRKEALEKAEKSARPSQPNGHVPQGRLWYNDPRYDHIRGTGESDAPSAPIGALPPATAGTAQEE
jgi:hypothetical protein